MPRRKPASAKQRKAELQIKRAVKRGDLPPETAAKPQGGPSRRGRGQKLNGASGRITQQADAKAQSSRRLESSFVKFSREVLEEAKEKASTIPLIRPIPAEKAILLEELVGYSESASEALRSLNILRRPKWNFEMTKKQVETNEEALFKKWLAETDKTIEHSRTKNEPQVDESNLCQEDGIAPLDTPEEMVYSTPLYERNLEVWRQLWRVMEISQILLVLLDSRCPPLHYPQSLHKYLSSFRPPRKVIFVLTKIDISGHERATLWSKYLEVRYPGISIVQVESYVVKTGGEGQGKRKHFEPYIRSDPKRNLVEALKAAHDELSRPSPYIVSHPEKLTTWQPSIKQDINWNALLSASDRDITTHIPVQASKIITAEGTADDGDVREDFVTVGLIGQPNVGKSSLLNALFGSHKVKASKTPGKTKHFQTLFWTNQVRLVDCPGLVFPNFVDMEMQVLAGILPVSQIPAIPSCTYHALQYLPLEKMFNLQHHGEKEPRIEDKRTWRARPGMPLRAKPALQWTAMDVLTAFAETKGWITAKASRPDINRAGNAILRALAEGKIKWAFYPPGTDPSKVRKADEGVGIWINNTNEDASDDDDLFSDEPDSDESVEESTEENEEGSDKEEEESDLETPSIKAGTGMFGALTLENYVSSDDKDSEGENIEDARGQ